MDAVTMLRAGQHGQSSVLAAWHAGTQALAYPNPKP